MKYYKPYDSFTFFIVSLLCTIGLGLTTCSIQAKQCLDQAIVIVNDSIITERDLERHLIELQKQQGELEIPNSMDGTGNHRPDRKNALDSLINTELTLQKAKLVADNISDAQFNQLITRIPQEMRAQLPMHEDMKQFKQTLIAQQLTYEALNRYNIKPTEPEIEEELKKLPSYPAETAPLEYHIKDYTPDLVNRSTTGSTSFHFVNPFLESLLKLIWPFQNNTLEHHNAMPSKQVHMPRDVLPLRPASEMNADIKQAFKERYSEDATEFLHLKVQDLGWRSAKQLPAEYVEAIQKRNPEIGAFIGPFRILNQLHYIKFLGKRGEEVMSHAGHILIASHTENDAAIEQKLKNIRELCLKQKNFEAQAKQHSEDPDSLFKGGDLGWVMPGTTNPIFEQHLHQLKVGEISMPFKTPKGWHIVRVIARQTLTPNHPMFKRYFAENIISRRKMMEALESWHEELRSHAYIKWLEPKFSDPIKRNNE